MSFELRPSVNSSDRTTSSSVNPLPETIGPRVITPMEPSWSTLSWMSCERKRRDVIVCRVSKSLIRSEEELVPVWERSSSPRFVRSSPIE